MYTRIIKEEMTQYKYYRKKPKSEITKDVLTWLAVGGMVAIAATSPYFMPNLLRSFKQGKRYNNRAVYNTFYRLRKEGAIDIQKKNHQIYISLTEEGKKRAGRFQINDLNITKPKKWDGKWRLILFDVEEAHRIKRNSLRGLLRGLELYQLQKSVWIHPYNCKDEIDLLREFFGLSQQELKLVVVDDLGKDETLLKKRFKL
ncbi:hypothetical protein IIA94_02120 [Patescibacteria group bacterium]|nr:hypothetical protein [Patescibacteria group bacterium]